MDEKERARAGTQHVKTSGDTRMKRSNALLVVLAVLACAVAALLVDVRGGIAGQSGYWLRRMARALGSGEFEAVVRRHQAMVFSVAYHLLHDRAQLLDTVTALTAEELRWLRTIQVLEMAGLPGFYRVIAFLVLAVMMAGAAWAYQKALVTRPGAGREVESHDAV